MWLRWVAALRAFVVCAIWQAVVERLSRAGEVAGSWVDFKWDHTGRGFIPTGLLGIPGVMRVVKAVP